MRNAAMKLLQKLSAAGMKNLFPKPTGMKPFLNGSSVFIPQIRTITLFYNPPRMGSGGDSKGMAEFILDHVVKLAEERKYVEIIVQKRLYQPSEIVAEYLCGRKKSVLCYKLDKKVILKHFNHLCNTEGRDGDAPGVTAPPPINHSRKPNANRRIKTPSPWARVKEDWKRVGRGSNLTFPIPVIRHDTAPTYSFPVFKI